MEHETAKQEHAPGRAVALRDHVGGRGIAAAAIATTALALLATLLLRRRRA